MSCDLEQSEPWQVGDLPCPARVARAMSVRPLSPCAVLARALIVVMVALAASTCSSSTPLAPGAQPLPVDVLDFVVGTSATWPRIGDQQQNQTVNATDVCWTKYTLGWMFECWRWDDRFVYHEVDHAIDGQRWVHYSFSDGRWLPRHLMPGSVWTLDLPDNRIRWVDATCVAQPDKTFPYRLRAWIEPSFDAGGDLGVREVLILEYEPYDPASQKAGLTERFYMARGAGWFEWSRSDGARVAFNRVGGLARAPTGLCP